MKVWEDKSENHSQVVSRAMQVLEEWNFYNAKRQQVQPEVVVRGRTYCSKPEPGMLKCNLDAAFFNTENATVHVIYVYQE